MIAIRALALSLAACVLASACGTGSDSASIARDLDRELAPTSSPPAREGLAAAILIDVSGSMEERGADEANPDARRIDVARRAADSLVQQFARYAAERPDEPVLLGIYEFSERGGEPDVRPLVPMAPPNRAAVVTALASAVADGGTPIGSAMIVAKRELDGTGLTRRHLLVITDGENTGGVAPEHVATAIGQRPAAERPSIYFVAFNVSATRFSRVRDAGGLVLEAANARELNETLDGLLRGKILVE